MNPDLMTWPTLQAEEGESPDEQELSARTHELKEVSLHLKFLLPGTCKGSQAEHDKVWTIP